MADTRPWSNDEKNELIAEVIRTASPHPSVLFAVVANLQIQPRWEDTPLPRGRSLNSCRFIFEELRRAPPLPPLVTGAYGPQTPLSAPPMGGMLKRPFPLDAPYPAGREIRPKPFPTQGSAAPPSTSEPPVKRKRGRPTKAEKKAEADAAARVEPSQAPLPQLHDSPQLTTTSMPGGARPTTAEEPKPPPPPPSRMPISAVLTPNAPKTASSSSSSSGKRRRGRSMRSEAEGYGIGEIGGSVRVQEYESPYGRAVDVPPDTPARTAAMRHREEAGLRISQPFSGPNPAEPTP